MTQDLVKTADLESMVIVIVKKHFSKFEKLCSKFESTLETEMNDKITKSQTGMQEEVDALSIENENLTRKVNKLEANENRTNRS